MSEYLPAAGPLLCCRACHRARVLSSTSPNGISLMWYIKVSIKHSQTPAWRWSPGRRVGSEAAHLAVKSGKLFAFDQESETEKSKTRGQNTRLNFF